MLGDRLVGLPSAGTRVNPFPMRPSLVGQQKGADPALSWTEFHAQAATRKALRTSRLQQQAIKLVHGGDHGRALPILTHLRDVGEGPAGPRVLLMIAYCYAHLDCKAKALQALEGAVAVGYKDWTQMATDSRLQMLEEEDGFQALVLRLKANDAASTMNRKVYRPPRPATGNPCQRGNALTQEQVDRVQAFAQVDPPVDSLDAASRGSLIGSEDSSQSA